MSEQQEHETLVVDTMRSNSWYLESLQIVRELSLPDWAIGAGFVRNAIWDRLHGYTEPTPLNDIDVLYFEPGDLTAQADERVEAVLFEASSDRPWSVRNQARMHTRNNDRAYLSTTDAMSFWLETPTCVAVRLETDDDITVIAPHGLSDLAEMRARPTPAGQQRSKWYQQRMREKNWPGTWPRVQVLGLD